MKIYLDKNLVCLSPREKSQTIEDYVYHDLPAQVANKPKGLFTANHKLIIVSFPPPSDNSSCFCEPHFAEVDSVYKQISENFNVFKENSTQLIRNMYLTFDKFIVYDNGFRSDITRASQYVFGKDFVITSEALIKNSSEPKVVPDKKINEETVRKFWKTFGIDRVYFIPPSKKVISHYFLPPIWEDTNAYETPRDIDYTVNSIPEHGIFTVDEEHYQEQKSFFREIEKKENIKFIKLPPAKLSLPLSESMDSSKIHLETKDLWGNSYIYLPYSAKIHNHSSPDVLSNCLIQIVKSRINDNMRHNGCRFISVGFTKVPLIMGLFYEKTLRCFTHTAPNLRIYKKFRRVAFQWEYSGRGRQLK